MSKLEELYASNAWDSRYDLPTVPFHSNPSIYSAYAAKLIGDEATELLAPYEKFLKSLEIAPGYITKWPGGEKSSHDELMGAAWFSSAFASRALWHLQLTDGYWKPPGDPVNQKEYVYRFIFLVPYLRARAHLPVSLWNQLKFSAHVLFVSFFSKPGEFSDHLLVWIMRNAMEEFAVCDLALRIWESRLLSKGYNPKRVFSEFYLTEVPVFGRLAGLDWK